MVSSSVASGTVSGTLSSTTPLFDTLYLSQKAFSWGLGSALSIASGSAGFSVDTTTGASLRVDLTLVAGSSLALLGRSLTLPVGLTLLAVSSTLVAESSLALLGTSLTLHVGLTLLAVGLALASGLLSTPVGSGVLLPALPLPLALLV